MKYDHRATVKLQVDRSAAMRSFCVQCGGPVTRVSAGYSTPGITDTDGPDIETYWRHLPKPRIVK